jgi:hypothetical protein
MIEAVNDNDRRGFSKERPAANEPASSAHSAAAILVESPKHTTEISLCRQIDNWVNEGGSDGEARGISG